MTNQTNNNNDLTQLRAEWHRLTAQLLTAQLDASDLLASDRGSERHLHALTNGLLGLATESLARHGASGNLRWRNNNTDSDRGGWGQWEGNSADLNLTASADDLWTADALNLRAGDLL
jgi:hypothetical protein